MKSRSISSAVYAAGVVFAPSEDEPREAIAPRVEKARLKQARPHPASAYEAKFVKANVVPARAHGWWRSFDLSWLLGRATA